MSQSHTAAPVTVLLSADSDVSLERLRRLLPLIVRSIDRDDGASNRRGRDPSANGTRPLHIDLDAPGPPRSFECRDGQCRERVADAIAPRHDVAFILHDTAEGDVSWSRVRRCRRNARRVYHIDHAAAYAAHPCGWSALLARKTALAMRRHIDRLASGVGRRLAAVSRPIEPDAIERNQRRADPIRAIPFDELDARIGDGFARYFSVTSAAEMAERLAFRPQAIFVAMLEALAGPLDTARIVEIGCGFGVQALMLRRATNRVIGVDPIAGRARAITRYGFANMVGVAGVGEHLPLADASADLIFAHDAIQHVCDIAATLAECHRVLRPGGTLAISEVNPWHPDLLYAYGPFTPMRLGCRQLYADQRAAYLREHAGLAPQTARRVAERTESFTARDLDTLAAAGLERRVEAAIRSTQTARGEFTPCRGPGGWCEERYLTASQLVRRVRPAGFRRVEPRTYCLAFDGNGRPHAVTAPPPIDLLFARYTILATK